MIFRYASIIMCFLCNTVVYAVEMRGSLELEYRQFLQSPLETQQHDSYLSGVLNPELYFSWNDNRQSVTLTPFYRWDQHDDQRTHADMRELYWLYTGAWYEISLGLRKVFWGTTESQHLVDIINQTDLVENPDGEDKLGQPMIASRLITNKGNLELYILPYFRERTFPGTEGRLRTIPFVDTNERALYEDAKRDKHIDWALRWSDTVGSWDIGVSYFYGTNREPEFVQATNSAGDAILLPYYVLMKQVGLDVQGAVGAWLWKLEVIRRDTRQNDFTATTAGFEYTFYNINQRGLDIGAVVEYLYDDRGENATTPFDEDVMFGLRLTPNDVQGTQFLLGIILDRTTDAKIYRLESSRRLSDHFKINLEALVFSGLPATDPFDAYRQDDYIQAGLTYYF